MVLAYVNSHFANTKHDTAAQQRAISGAKTGISELPVNSLPRFSPFGPLPWHSKWMARLRIKKCINHLWVAEIGVLRNEIEFDKFVPSIGAILLLMNNTSTVPNTSISANIHKQTCQSTRPPNMSHTYFSSSNSHQVYQSFLLTAHWRGSPTERI